MRPINEPAVFKSSVGVVLKGDTGDSAYDIAVKMGFVGTEAEWLQSLKGEAIKAEAFTEQALQYSNTAQNYALAAGTSATEAKGYRDEAQAIKDSMSQETESALNEINAAKSDAQQIQADAEEVRQIHSDVMQSKNEASEAVEQARLYAEGVMAPTLLYYNRDETQDLLTNLETQVENNVSSDMDTLRTNVSNDVNNALQGYYRKSETYSRAESDENYVAKRDVVTIGDSQPENGLWLRPVSQEG